MLAMRQINKSYPVGPTALAVLKQLNLSVKTGEMLAIMGGSGSGKSTLMNIIGLLDVIDSGEFLFDGRLITALSDDQLADARNRLIGFIFQSFNLLPKLNAWENVAVPLLYRRESAQQQKKQAYQILEKVAMQQRAEHKPHQLSGGQRQRVAIARALVGKPKLLLADEPTGALDPVVGKEIMALFRQLNKQDGITQVIITHDPKVAEQCDRTLIMKDGALQPL